MAENKVVAVEAGLEPISEKLRQRGFQVVSIDDGMRDAAAVVISGGDRNVTGRTTISTEAPVIEASGRTPEQVVEDIERGLSAQRG